MEHIKQTRFASSKTLNQASDSGSCTKSNFVSVSGAKNEPATFFGESISEEKYDEISRNLGAFFDILRRWATKEGENGKD